jgi:hypothetical protein
MATEFHCLLSQGNVAEADKIVATLVTSNVPQTEPRVDSRRCYFDSWNCLEASIVPGPKNN